MPRIVHFIHRDDKIGGGATALIHHLRHYGKKYDTWFFHSCSDGPIARTCGELGIPHVQFPVDRLWKCAYGIFPLIAKLRKIKPDLLIVHGQWAGPVGALAGKIAGVPRILYISQSPAFYSDWDIYRVARNHIAEWLATALADRLVMLSEGTHYQYLIRQLPIDGKVTRLSNMFDLARVPSVEAAAAIRKEFQWKPGCVHVVSVGRFSHQKRVDWLLESWKIIQDSGVNARLWIVGGGELDAQVRKVARQLGLEKTCTFLGPRPNGIEFIAAADIVAMTTLYEAHAFIPLEAMACGRPIVANSADGVADSFTGNGEEGFLVSPGDIKGFANRLLTLIRDPDLRRVMGENGKVRSHYYDASVVLDRYVALIDQFLAT